MAGSREQVNINVPSSSANVGLYYDVACLGLETPLLSTTLTRNPNSRGINVTTESPLTPPEGRKLGYAGKVALEELFKQHGVKNEGVDLHYQDTGYPVGGLGRSGAESVGAVMAAAVMYDLRLDRNDVVFASAKGEPGGHMDNVAGSTNGRFNLIAKSPHSGELGVDYYDIPDDLGIAIGISSHQKTGGTEEGRKVMTDSINSEDFVTQSGLIAASSAALIRGNTDRFLELVAGDRYHEVRRANIGFYGKFNSQEFIELKKLMWKEFGVALNVSGAGPNMEILYNRGRSTDEVDSTLYQWFDVHEIKLKIMDTEVAIGGAYDNAEQVYNYKTPQTAS